MNTTQSKSKTTWYIAGTAVALLVILAATPFVGHKKVLTLTSTAFKEGDLIPSKYTCDNPSFINPPLSISGVPKNTKSLALLVDDPDVPKALKPDGVFDHWVLFNIPADTTTIPETNSVGTTGANGLGKNAYFGPCPPAEYEPSTHRYFFKLYALDTMLTISATSSKNDVIQAMQGHIISQTELIGKYKKQVKQ